jgi:phage/plasmid-associated DNA primase
MEKFDQSGNSVSRTVTDQQPSADEAKDSAAEVATLEAGWRATVTRAIDRARSGDIASVYEADVIAALMRIKRAAVGTYLEMRRDLKGANAAVSLVELDRAMKGRGGWHEPETHHSFAKKALSELTVMGHAPVYVDGQLFVVDGSTNLWIPKEDSAIYEIITRNHDGHRLCSTQDDYRGIKSLVHGLAQQGDFFAEGPVGIATPKGFYRVEEGRIALEPLMPHHRQRVRIPFDVRAQETPLFLQFLDETFHSGDPEEMAQQQRLVQEIAGAIMLGLMHKQQKAVLFYDPYGRAGKGTLETVLRNLVPEPFISAVSPFNWDREYYLMALAGARLNVVGELPDDKAMR